MNLKIEHGIPMPDISSRNRNGIILALNSMKKGDSFVWEGRSISNIYVLAKMAGIKITVHRLADDSFRIWRAE